ncbi:MAG: DUF6033 family protein [Lachnospiraceae bacterium]|nr:DUF6033 family protein [Lachnospiraceae bacterium]
MSVNLQNIHQYQNAAAQKYAANRPAPKADEKGLQVEKNAKTEKAETVNLSDAAKELLKELQNTYGNMDFIVADYETDEEAQEYLSHGTKEYSVLLDPDTLEAMAADESVKEEYLTKLEDATVQLSDISKQLEEEGAEVTRLGVSIKADGTTSFFAQLEKAGEDQEKLIENLKEAREEAKEAQEEKAEKAQEKKAQKAAADEALKAKFSQAKVPGVKTTTVSADTVEELIEKIRNVDWDQVESKVAQPVGGKIDFTA